MENNKKEPADKQVLNTQIVAQLPSQVQEFNPEKQVEQAKIAAKALMSVINQKSKPVKFNGEQYLEFEDWQTVAQFYMHTVGTEWTKEVLQKGEIYGYEAKANLYDRNGVVVGGAEAGCLKDEPNWKSKPLFQLRSMAQTRAMAKALRSKFGFVAVLAGFKPTPAEEMDSVRPSESVQTPEVPYYCSVHDNSMTLRPAGVTKQGTPYKAFWACTKKDNGSFCKGPFLNPNGEVVKQNPETGEMQIVDKPVEAEIVIEETAIDKARKMIKVPPNRGEQIEFNK